MRLEVVFYRTTAGREPVREWLQSLPRGDRRIARVLFTMVGDEMILLHGFIKKARKTPTGDIELARSRKAKLEH